MSCFTSNYVLPHIISLIVFFSVHLIKGNPSIYYGVHEVMDNHFIYIYNDSWLVLPNRLIITHLQSIRFSLTKLIFPLHSLLFRFLFTFLVQHIYIYINSNENIDIKRLWPFCSHLLWINLSLYVWYVPHFVAYVNNYWEVNT